MKVLHKLFAFVAIAFYLFAPTTIVFAQTTATTTSSTAVTCKLSLSKSSITAGGSAKLSWKSTNATSGAIVNIGNVAASGTIMVHPSNTTTYIGSFTGPTGTANCSITLKVTSTATGGGSASYGVQTATIASGCGGSSSQTSSPLRFTYSKQLDSSGNTVGTAQTVYDSSGTIVGVNLIDSQGTITTTNPSDSSSGTLSQVGLSVNYTRELDSNGNAIGTVQEFNDSNGNLVNANIINSDGSITSTSPSCVQNATLQNANTNGTQNATLQNSSANGFQYAKVGSTNSSGATQTSSSGSSGSNTSSSNSSFLVPCGYGSFTNGQYASGSATDQGSTGCQACSLAQLVQNIINFIIGLSIPVAAALFAWAGVLYFTSAENISQRQKAKDIFKNAFIGFVIIITAWLVINTLLNVIFNQSSVFKGGNWFQIQCSAQRPISGNIGTILSQALGTAQPIAVSTNPLTATNPSLSYTDQQTIQNALKAACDSGDTASCYGSTYANGSYTLTSDAQTYLENNCQDSLSSTQAASCQALVDYAAGGTTSISGSAGIAAGVQALTANAYSTSQGICATNVRLALIAEDAASGDTYFVKNYPPVASQYDSYLTSDGFTAVTQNIQDGYTPQQGDVAVFQPVVGHDAGHIEMYSGSQWVSDFVQPGFYASTAYQTQKGSYTVYRK